MYKSTRKVATTAVLVTGLLILSLLPGVSSTTPSEASSGILSFRLTRGDGGGGASYVIGDGGESPFPSGSHGPFYELYGYVTNSLRAQSIRGFEGTVDVEVSNVPPGVTVESFPSFTLERGESVSFPLAIRVSESVPLGTEISGITITGTSGSVSKTATVATFTVVDPLPCSSYWAPVYCYFPGN